MTKTNLKPLELLHRAWEDRGERISICRNSQQTQELTDSPFNDMRDEIMQYIQEHKNMLSLPCNGNCYEHTDGVVVYCHQQLMEDKNG